MDDADKIKQDFTHKEVALFLGDDLKLQGKEKVVTYNLEKEYAKTKKNRQPFVWLLLAGCFLLVGAGTFLTIKLLSNSNNKITINIDSFDDLNLKALLSSTGRIKNAKSAALTKKKILESALENELARAKQKMENDLFTLKSMEPVATKESVKERRERINAEYKELVEKIKTEYEPLINSAQEDISLLERQESNYDSTKVSKAQEEEDAIDSTKQLHDLEMSMMADRYEKEILRLQEELIAVQNKAAQDQKNAVEEVRRIYQAKIDLLDPKAREQNANQDRIILETGIKNQTPVSNLWHSIDTLNFTPESYTSTVSNPEKSFTDALTQTQKELEELKIIGSRFKPIPMENSIKDYVPAMINQSYTLAENMASSQAAMQVMLNKERQASYNKDFFLEKYIEEHPCDGILLSVQPDYITAYVKNEKQALITEEPCHAQIIKGTKASADITVQKDENFYIIKITEPAQENIKKQSVYEPAVGDRFKLVFE